MGHHRLRPRARRGGARLGVGDGPLRRQTPLPDRGGGLRAGLPAGRTGVEHRLAHRLPGRAGGGRGIADARRHDHPRACGHPRAARPADEHAGSGDPGRPARRAGVGRLPDRRGVVAVDVPGERAGGRAGVGAGEPGVPGRPARAAPPPRRGRAAADVPGTGAGDLRRHRRHRTGWLRLARGAHAAAGGRGPGRGVRAPRPDRARAAAGPAGAAQPRHRCRGGAGRVVRRRVLRLDAVAAVVLPARAGRPRRWRARSVSRSRWPRG